MMDPVGNGVKNTSFAAADSSAKSVGYGAQNGHVGYGGSI